MKTLLVLLSVLISINSAFATDFGVEYIKKGGLSGIAVKVSVLKLESLSRNEISKENTTITSSELNLIAEPDINIAQFKSLSLFLSPAVGISKNLNSSVTYDTTALKPHYINYEESKHLNLITGASVGVSVDLVEKFHLLTRFGVYSVGGGYKGRASVGASIEF
jgi:hypothetical protein